MLVEIFIFGKSHYLARLVVSAGERADQAESNRLVGDELQIFAIDFDAIAFLCAAGHKAHGGIVAQANVISARQTAANQHPGTRRADIRAVGRAAGDSKVEIAVSGNLRALSIPVFDHVGDAGAADFGNEEATVEENRI